MKVNVQYAETHLADLISAASRGEIVEIDAPDACAQIYASPKPAAANLEPSSEVDRSSRSHLWRAWERLVTLPEARRRAKQHPQAAHLQPLTPPQNYFLQKQPKNRLSSPLRGPKSPNALNPLEIELSKSGTIIPSNSL